MELKEHIFNFEDAQTLETQVPEWDCVLYIRSWSGEDRSKLLAWTQKKDAQANGEFNARVCALSLANDKGQRLFEDKDYAQLQKKNGQVLDRLAKIALKFNGLSDDAVEEAEKN